MKHRSQGFDAVVVFSALPVERLPVPAHQYLRKSAVEAKVRQSVEIGRLMIGKLSKEGPKALLLDMPD